jgi:hypothetical protein
MRAGGQGEFMDALTLEKYSSAFTLSDMEVFIFPELFYALVLANIMSPRIWAWRDDPWFADLAAMGFNRRLQRLKQYVMDHYSFNLDLETWGLTTKPREISRFSKFIDPEILGRSNALFGYEGDKYYFDIDIRKHFGLDKYTSDDIPYWKTETVEAMDAFRYKPGHQRGAGECVSLSALYAAAFYIVLGVPLEDIFLLATPLHSQNFVTREHGVLTNNRRLVTKTMWFNGTALSEKARRALEKERVTIVSHVSGYVHIDYPEATIDPAQYRRLDKSLRHYLSTPVNFEIFANFLRTYGEYRKYFQFEYALAGRQRYISAEKLYHYEHASQNRIGDATRSKLLAEVETEDFEPEPYADRVTLNLLELQLNGQPLQCRAEDAYAQFRQSLDGIPEADELCRRLCHFACTTPRLPAMDKTYLPAIRPEVPVGWSREEIITYLSGLRAHNVTVDLAFLAGRRLRESDWEPYLKACLERNPVCREFFARREPEAVYQALAAMPDESIYAGDGLATPDEVVNFGRGDGLEKAVCLANVLRNRPEPPALRLTAGEGRVELSADGRRYEFQTAKNFKMQRSL